jgi:hypothetical protein
MTDQMPPLYIAPYFRTDDTVTLDEGTDVFRIVKEPTGRGAIYTIAPVGSDARADQMKVPAYRLHVADASA